MKNQQQRFLYSNLSQAGFRSPTIFQEIKLAWE